MENAVSGLSVETRRLLEEARDMDDPSFARQHRVRERLAAHLGVAAMAGTAAASAAAAATPVGLTVGSPIAGSGAGTVGGAVASLAKAVVGLTIVAGMGAGTWSSGDVPGVAPALSSRDESAAPMAAAAAVQGRAPEPVVDDRETALFGAGVPTPADDAESDVDESVDQDLARHGVLVSIARRPGHPVAIESELVLIERAELAFAEKNYPRAARYLNAHALKFPYGALGENRESLRLLIQCAVGSVAKASVAAEKFAQVYPDSDQLPRLAASGCLPPGVWTGPAGER
jgi:hypothetical protein